MEGWTHPQSGHPVRARAQAQRCHPSIRPTHTLCQPLLQPPPRVSNSAAQEPPPNQAGALTTRTRLRGSVNVAAVSMWPRIDYFHKVS